MLKQMAVGASVVAIYGQVCHFLGADVGAGGLSVAPSPDVSHQYAMLTLGFTTLIDVLSWIVALSLSVKVVATLIVLIVDREMRDQPGWGSALWWTTKITPIVAVPCLIWIALLEGDASLAWLFLALGLFVTIAVPLKIRQRRDRIAKRMSARSLARR